jgi:hypothetical protein
MSRKIMRKAVAVLVLIGSITGPSLSQTASIDSVPDCVREWMDLSPQWREFQVSVEDSLEALRTRNWILSGQNELLRIQLESAKEDAPSWLEQWGLVAGVALVAGASVWIGASAAR